MNLFAIAFIFSHGWYRLPVGLCFRRPSDGDVQRRHSRQSSGRQRPVSTGALATTAAAVNTSHSSSPGVNARSNVSASTPSVPQPPPGQPPPGKFTFK